MALSQKEPSGPTHIVSKVGSIFDVTHLRNGGYYIKRNQFFKT